MAFRRRTETIPFHQPLTLGGPRSLVAGIARPRAANTRTPLSRPDMQVTSLRKIPASAERGPPRSLPFIFTLLTARDE